MAIAKETRVPREPRRHPVACMCLYGPCVVLFGIVFIAGLQGVLTEDTKLAFGLLAGIYGVGCWSFIVLFVRQYRIHKRLRRGQEVEWWL